MSVGSRVDRFFELFPAAQSTYARTRLYHLTHSRYLPGIQADGLRPNQALFPAEHGAFLLRMLERYGSGHPSDAEYIKNRILDPSKIYLSRTQPDMNGYVGYGVPERLVFLMRGMNALATKTSLTSEERVFAAQALGSHRDALTAGNPAIVALEVDPLAPGVVNNRLGRMMLEQIEDEATAVEAVRYVDGLYDNNIPITDNIPPEFISVFGKAPLDPTESLRSVETEPGWATSIR